MWHIQGESADALFIDIAKIMLEAGKRRFVRGCETIELYNCWMEISDPTKSRITLKSREVSKNYEKGELEWYNSGSLLVKDIAEFSKFWNQLADSNGTVNSNYGFLVKLEKWAGISQYEWVIDRLTKDRYTRQAIINYNQPKHKYPHVKDFVCTISQTFIVNDEKLDSIVLMRSNDLIYGLTYDLPWFCGLQLEVAKELNIPVGKYFHYDTSLHVYEQHFKMLENIAQEVI